MRQIFCLFVFVFICHSLVCAKSNSTTEVSASIPSLAQVSPPTDTFVFFLYTQSSLTVCADTLEVQPIGTINAFNCGNNTGATFTLSPTMNGCIDFSAIGNEGIDTICVEICNSVVPSWCDTSVLIFNVNAPPPPTANQDNISVLENDSVVINPIANDIVLGNPSIFITTFPEHGELTLDGNNNLLNYVPDENYCGTDSIEYNICNGNCDIGTILIDVVCDGIEGDYKIFNSFSPNGDGVNDFFTIQGVGDFSKFQLRIFNRWGIEVYRSVNTGYTNDWDGTWGGKVLPDGTYFYTFKNLDTNTVDKGYLQIYR